LAASKKVRPESNWGLFWETCVEVDPAEARESKEQIDYGKPEGAVGGKPAGPTEKSGELASAGGGKPAGPTERS
jgi:hypothetical protein